MSDSDLLYMCKTDFDHELGHNPSGNTLYPSLEDAKEHLGCWGGCGIVAVRVVYIETVEPCRHFGGSNSPPATTFISVGGQSNTLKGVRK